MKKRRGWRERGWEERMEREEDGERGLRVAGVGEGVMRGREVSNMTRNGRLT